MFCSRDANVDDIIPLYVCQELHEKLYFMKLIFVFWPTVLLVEPLVQYVVCLSVVCLSACDILYCGETVRASQKLSEGVNRKPGSKS